MPDVTADPIMKIALGFMAAKHLFVANEIGLFEKLAAGPVTLDGLAEKTGIPRRTTRIVADAMVSLGFLEKEGDRYCNSAVAAAFLSGKDGAGLRPMLRFLDRNRYRHWLDLEAAVRTDGGHTKWGRMSEDEQRVVSEGIAAWTLPVAAALAGGYEFGRHRHVLDLGGGTGNFLLAVLARHPGLSGTLFELPDTAAVARRELAGRPEASRINVVDGDMFEDPLPQGADAVIVANVVHIFPPKRNLAMFERVRRQVAAGAAAACRLLDRSDAYPTAARPAYGGRVLAVCRRGRRLQRGGGSRLAPRYRVASARTQAARGTCKPAHRRDGGLSRCPGRSRSTRRTS